MQSAIRSSRHSRRLSRAARTGLLVLAVVFCALLATASTSRTPRAHRPLPVQQLQTSARSKSHAQTHAKPLAPLHGLPHGKLHSTTHAGPQRRSAHPLTHAHSRSRVVAHAIPPSRRRKHPVPADNPDPPTVERTRAHRSPSHPLSPAEARRATALQSAQLAARIEASVEAQARNSPSSTQAYLQPPAPIVRTPTPQRVDGFGAEGASLPAPAAPADSESPNYAYTDLPATRPDLDALAHPSTTQLAEAAVQPRLYTSSGRLILPAPLKGSHDVLVHQNLMADDEGLSRIQDDDELDRLRAAHLLVDLPVSASLSINPELPANRRCARPWTARFAADTARAFYARFHQQLQVNSAVRTVDVQLRLLRSNGNAAPAEGDTASPHLTGQAIDFAKRGMSLAQIAWMRSYLLPLMNSGKIDVEEEFQQACFHVSVYRSYLPIPSHRTSRTLVAQLPAR